MLWGELLLALTQLPPRIDRIPQAIARPIACQRFKPLSFLDPLGNKAKIADQPGFWGA
ncbi:MAG: hypothetical protein GDA43_21980 [Hormoscilla sp. SP5CHS1]|nr:hypothetical protein [Hormoscilla sp. SP12CHS1]MBC6455526.1 hypothetical protein [Hormoscilla sp. SP5CHS1]